MSIQGCPECSIENAEYLGNEEDGTPIYKCKSCGTVFASTCKMSDKAEEGE